jgi:hypothetical protein
MLSPSPQVFAGEDGVITPDSIFTSIQATTEFTDQIIWSTNGDGAYYNPEILQPQYTPGPNDIAPGLTQLIITGFNTSCDPKSDTLNLFLRYYFTVEGRVNMGKMRSAFTPVIAAGINVVNADFFGDMLQTDAEGNFRFEKLFAGEYVLYALPDTGAGNGYLPAYHPNKSVW